MVGADLGKTLSAGKSRDFSWRSSKLIRDIKLTEFTLRFKGQGIAFGVKAVEKSHKTTGWEGNGVLNLGPFAKSHFRLNREEGIQSLESRSSPNPRGKSSGNYFWQMVYEKDRNEQLTTRQSCHECPICLLVERLGISPPGAARVDTRRRPLPRGQQPVVW
jgi:hypothetical protein